MLFTLEQAELAPGTVGAVFDDTPKLTTALVRPFLWAVLMFRTAIKSHEVVHALSAVCSTEDLKIDEDDEEGRTWAEICVDEVLGEMTSEGLLRYNSEKDFWVLRYSRANVPTVIKAVAGVNGRMPSHFQLEMAQEGQ